MRTKANFIMVILLCIGMPSFADVLTAHNPQPFNEETGVVVEGLTLSWNAAHMEDPVDPNFTYVNPDITSHYVYLSTDPNLPVSPAIVGADVNPVDGVVDEVASYTPPETLSRNTVYYWRVDESINGSAPDDPNTIAGPSWSFATESTGPVVDSGLNWVVWLDPDEASVQLDATVSDPDGEPVTILWEVIKAPRESTVVFDPDTSVEDPIVTVDTLGKYWLKITGTDEEDLADSEMLEILVFSDSCEAARNNPKGYIPFETDFNEDCIVNIEDLTVYFLSEWLVNNLAIENEVYESEVKALLQNGGFETGDFSYWSINNAEINTDNVLSGDYCAEIKDGSLYQYDILVTPGRNYELSVFVRGLGVADDTLNWGAYDEDGDFFDEFINDVNSAYKKITKSFTAGEREVINVWIRADSGTVTLDDFKFVEVW